ncbi:NnrS family protein [Peteryoungia ipomoeae]|uniref:NnrS family protein n=1 Tax=Peteryoungia ipomoeae TaxID=1210932 RepID=UPI0014562E3D|nr:NnrS family protein [Peteryoungia ipomoeae]
MTDPEKSSSGGIPRGLARDGSVLLSYGFRPFYLAAGVWAVATMAIWVLARKGLLDLPDTYGHSAWHAHELIFGFMPAVLIGYLMTTVPNWTGRFPLSGAPLARLALVWLAGRISMFLVDGNIVLVAVVIDGVFLPLFAFFCLKEAWVARRIGDGKPILAVSLLACLNLGFHAAAITGGDVSAWARAGLSVYVVLIASTASKLVPSFTNNWLAQRGRPRLAPARPVIDRIVVGTTLFAAILWTLAPFSALTAIAAIVAAGLHVRRASAWLRPAVLRSSMIVAIQISYAFIPLGLLGIGATALGMSGPVLALHLLAIGAVSGMMLAIMNRSIRLHTGRNESSSWPMRLSVPCLLFSAGFRSAAEFLPGPYEALILTSGLLWIAGFVFFLWDNAGPLCRVMRKPGRQPSPPTRISIR